ncbi:MAG: phosphodiester glycosidase family protein, partial [Solirubrobacterales bacterium]|nr:phosphodiester glycosidase family protein [Solirubrobacterales bacterium]
MLAPPKSPVQTPPPSVPPRTGRAAARPSRWSRARRVALVAAIVCLIPAFVSYVQAIAQRSDSSLGIRTVEWMRDNGARSLVNTVENWYYSLTAPAKGGPELRSLPAQAGAYAGTAAPSRRVVHHYRPHSIKPIIHPALPGEGVWHATYAAGGSRPPVLITSYRPNPDYPRIVAGVAWIDHTRTSVQLYPGLQEPAVALPSRGPMEVPQALRGRLVATFNSGFKLADSSGGFVYAGHTYAPMHDGMATLVRYRSGRVDVTPWSGGADAGPDVAYARQDLPLIVNHGHVNPNLSDGPEWGATLGNAIFVWRSAVGIDRHGNLIYAAAPDQTVASLAQIMIHAGAVRAMELDINAYWPSFITYRFPGAAHPANLLADMVRSPLRYLTPDDR